MSFRDLLRDTLVTLWALGVPLFAKAPPPPRPDGVPIPLSGKAVPAYTRLLRDHFRHPNQPFVLSSPSGVSKAAQPRYVPVDTLPSIRFATQGERTYSGRTGFYVPII